MSAASEKKNVQHLQSSPEKSVQLGVVSRTSPAKPRTFPNVPTHAFGMAVERRFHPRAALRLPLRLTRVNHQEEAVPITLLTKNISSSGVYFLAPRRIEPGTPIELEVGLVDRPLGRGRVRMRTVAHVVRIEDISEPGWFAMAARFDDIAFQRDEELPPRFLK